MHFVSSRWDADAFNPSAMEPDLPPSLRRREGLTSPTQLFQVQLPPFSQVPLSTEIIIAPLKEENTRDFHFVVHNFPV